MAKIIVGFSRPRSKLKPFSWLIQLWQWTPYSHTYVKFYSAKYDRWLTYQASHALVNFYGPAAWEAEALVVREFEIEVSDEVYRRVMTYAIDKAGLPYDLTSIFGIVAVAVAGLFGKKIANPLNSKNGFFCSELVGSILVELLGEEIRGEISTLTPKDIYEHLERRRLV